MLLTEFQSRLITNVFALFHALNETTAGCRLGIKTYLTNQATTKIIRYGVSFRWEREPGLFVYGLGVRCAIYTYLCFSFTVFGSGGDYSWYLLC